MKFSVATAFTYIGFFFLAFKAFAAPVTIDRQTCKQAQEQVRRTKRFWRRTVDGPIPIGPLSPSPYCDPRQRVWFYYERTVDSARCLLGHVCIMN